MSEPNELACDYCAGTMDDHSEFCPSHPKNKTVNPPHAVYDLAEFERQLEIKRQEFRDRCGHYNRPIVEALDAVIGALRASKLEAK